tara:strand:+ start:163 stop:357 length:195 start_codon:yes stop_codon:yes gene_type:complete
MAKSMKKSGGRGMYGASMKRKGKFGVSKKKSGGLKGKQSKLDMNKNGRIDGDDFKMLRKKKKKN